MASILDTVWGTGPQRAKRRPAGPGARPTPGGDAKKLKRLSETESFGANPGALRMLSYAPKDLAPGASLVVVLHGCTQNAEGYDAHSGWSALADEAGFALLYPEQRRRNNALGCFNWFQTADSARGLGEARSIREMIETLIARHGIDRGRIFVAGLSAGGAMTAVMLAAYPDVFSAGAIIAGLPCGAATSVGQAFDAMANPPARADGELGDAVRAGAPYAGPWPRVSIWHGLEDRTVAPGNADLLVRQWLDVHGATPTPASDDLAGRTRRRVWTRDGRAVVQAVTIEGMGHGTPLGGAPGERPGPYMLDVGVSSTREIAAFFGLTAKEAAADAAPQSERRKSAPRKVSATSPRAVNTAVEDAPALAPDEDAAARHAPATAPSRPPSTLATAADEPAGPDTPAKTSANVSDLSFSAPALTQADGGSTALEKDRAETAPPRDAVSSPASFETRRADGTEDAGAPGGRGRIDIRAVIEKALKTAGLMR